MASRRDALMTKDRPRRHGDVKRTPAKDRGFCPSCGGRRMTECPARLVDGILPRVPVRSGACVAVCSAGR